MTVSDREPTAQAVRSALDPSGSLGGRVVAHVWRRFLNVVERVGADPSDHPELRLKKAVLVSSTVDIALAGIIWGTIYFLLGEPVAASIPWGYSLASAASMSGFALTRRYRLFRDTQLTLILLAPFLLQLSLGGFVDASAVILWSLLAPLGAMLTSGRRYAVWWFGAYVGLVLVAQIVHTLLSVESTLPTAAIVAFFILNIVGVSLVMFLTLHYFVGERDRAMALLGTEQQKSERLLLNILPKEIAAILKDQDQTIAQHFPAVSVLFADIVEFTPMAARMTPDELVGLLNHVFSYFDALVDEYHCEKIRTIGDSYMVASGVPTPRDDHAHALARLALDMNSYMSGVFTPEAPLRLRLGINSGPVVAGVIGKAKFQYDIWGDTVNIASRMESHGLPERIQITKATRDLINDEFNCVPRGLIEVKGKGDMETWFLEGALS